MFGGYDGEKRLNDVWLFDGERKVVSCFFVCICFAVIVGV